MKIKMPAWGIGFVSLNLAAWMPVAAHPIDEHQQGPDVAAASIAGDSRTALTASDAQALGPVIERALARYFESRGVEFAPSGELAGLIADEVASRREPETRAAHDENAHTIVGRRDGVVSRGVVAGDEVELRLTETGSGPSDYVQLVLDTPAATGSSAWSLAVRGDNGTLFLSGPSFVDAFQVDPTNSKFRVALLELPDVVRLIPKTVGSRPLCSVPTTEDEGRLYYDSSDGLCYCDGTSWKKVDGNAAC